ncbi:hypothetical protein C0416_01125 [bacterium]|nr:hypothetical protein [bacterium]
MGENTLRNDEHRYLSDIKRPFIDPEKVAKSNPTVLELVAAVRSEVANETPANEKIELVIDNVRYALAIVFKDEGERYVLIGRESIRGNEMANENTSKDDLARLEGVDFPAASRGVLPNSTFKVNESLDNAKIEKIELIGVANEIPGINLGAVGDASAVVMPCYVATISEEDVNRTKGNNGRILTVEQILELSPEQCSSKVKVLQEYLRAKV